MARYINLATDFGFKRIFKEYGKGTIIHKRDSAVYAARKNSDVLCPIAQTTDAVRR